MTTQPDHRMAENTNTEREATGPAEVWLRSRYGAYRGHFAWRELEEAFNAGRASLPLPAAGQEPVARSAAERDELLQAAIDFIRTLTGMEPPPIEVAPPEVFAPFRELVDKVQSITTRFVAPQPAAAAQEPIDMVLHCPKCGLQHIDSVEESDRYRAAVCEVAGVVESKPKAWENPPHRSHLCHGCGHIWRPADVSTNGVQAVNTKGKKDSPIAAPQPAVAAGWIGVKDRLPEAYVEVLLVLDGKHVTTGEYMHSLSCFTWEPHDDELDDSKVTHWMPLPPAPSTEGA